MSSSDTSKKGLLVLGVGQMRTGTASLKEALGHLYKGQCYHMRNVVDDQYHIKLWKKCVDRRKLDKETADIVFKDYVAAVDYPAALFYKDLLELYPNVKVVLSIRDADSWIRSVRQTTMPREKLNFISRVLMYLTGFGRFMEMRDGLFEMAFHRSLNELRDDDILKECYTKYNNNVKKFIPGERMLVFEAKEGWGPLCSFLDKPIPDIPYPNVNNVEEFRLFVNKRFKRRMIRLVMSTVLCGVCVYCDFIGS